VFDSHEAFREAVKRAAPDESEVKELKQETVFCEGRLKRVKGQMKTLARKVSKAVIADEIAKQTSDELMAEFHVHTDRLEDAKRKLDTIPLANVESIKWKSHERQFSDVMSQWKKILDQPLTFKRKRQIIEGCLMGQSFDSPNQQAGVYVEAHMESPKRVHVDSVDILATVPPQLLTTSSLIDAHKRTGKQSKQRKPELF
jgi:hypothetical protein